MDFKLCVCDLDGTILNSGGVIPECHKKAILSLKSKGITFVLATGRSDLQVLEYLDELEAPGPVIVCNGGLVKNHRTGEVLCVSFIDEALARRAVDYCLLRGLDYLLYTPDYVYHAVGSERINKFINYNKTARPEHRVPIACVADIPDGILYKNVIKVLVYHDIGIIPELNEKINFDDAFTIVTSGENLVDIMTYNTSKGTALKFIADHLGIKIAETISFGDSLNDESLISAAGFGVAMGNAEEEIKEIADFVTLTNDECGIAYAVSKIIDGE